MFFSTSMCSFHIVYLKKMFKKLTFAKCHLFNLEGITNQHSHLKKRKMSETIVIKGKSYRSLSSSLCCVFCLASLSKI
uniref:Uncharacterized protein n=1 Tax=Anguilla anguilla TaxID=7936 RepID=A0A0E9WGV3_ANGAN